MTPDFSRFTDGLLPVIIQDHTSGKVLMLGYMNQEAWAATQSRQQVVFYSRSRKRLWMKGETSGNYLWVQEVMLDCDKDAMLIKVIPKGPVCHTGADTCFGESNHGIGFLLQLQQLILQRRQQPEAGSYTSALFQQGINKIAQKLGEEAVELIIEAKDQQPHLLLEEAADLLFHYLVLLSAKDTTLQQVVAVLGKRHAAQHSGS